MLAGLFSPQYLNSVSLLLMACRRVVGATLERHAPYRWEWPHRRDLRTVDPKLLTFDQFCDAVGPPVVSPRSWPRKPVPTYKRVMWSVNAKKKKKCFCCSFVKYVRGSVGFLLNNWVHFILAISTCAFSRLMSKDSRFLFVTSSQNGQWNCQNGWKLTSCFPSSLVYHLPTSKSAPCWYLLSLFIF